MTFVGTTYKQKRPRSPEHARAISEGLKRRYASPESEQLRWLVGTANRGKKLSPERVEKARLAAIGAARPPLSDEHKLKISVRHRGWQPSPQTRIRMQLGQIGRAPASPETRERISASKKGVKNPAWRGGRSSERTNIYNSPDYKQWRMHVLVRDNFTCQACGHYGGRLEIDHEMPFSLFPDLRLEILNGRVLCKPCHRKTPTYAGKNIHNIFGSTPPVFKLCLKL